MRRFAVVLPALLGLVLTGGIEMALRFAGYRYAATEVTFRFAGPELDMPQFVRDSRLFWRIRPGSPDVASGPDSPVHNRNGFRGPLVKANRTSGVARVAALGDSCTYGAGVSYRESYVGMLEAKLEEAIHRPVEMINAGVPGYTSYQGLKSLETKILPLSPDVVTVYFGNWNDFVPAIGGDDAAKAMMLGRPHWVEQVRDKLAGLRMFMLAEQVADRFGGAHDSEFGRRTRDQYIEAFQRGQPIEGRRVPPEAFETNLVSIVHVCRAHRISVVFINPALPLKTRQEFPVYQTYNAIVSKVGERERVPVVPAAAEMASRESAGENMYLDWVHPNARGHSLIAELLAPEVAKALSTHH